MSTQRAAAIVALVVAAATVGLAIAIVVTEFPRGIGVLACVLAAGASAFYGALRRGAARVAGLAFAVLASPGPWRCSSRADPCSASCWSSPGSWCP